jgi:hypothetical protein
LSEKSLRSAYSLSRYTPFIRGIIAALTTQSLIFSNYHSWIHRLRELQEQQHLDELRAAQEEAKRHAEEVERWHKETAIVEVEEKSPILVLDADIQKMIDEIAPAHVTTEEQLLEHTYNRIQDTGTGGLSSSTSRKMQQEVEREIARFVSESQKTSKSKNK